MGLCPKHLFKKEELVLYLPTSCLLVRPEPADCLATDLPSVRALYYVAPLSITVVQLLYSRYVAFKVSVVLRHPL